MLRYHKQVYFNNSYNNQLISLNNKLNNISFKYTLHCIDNIKYRIIDINKLLLFIKNISLNYQDIFEYYYNENINIIEKICYRIKYTLALDIILILSKDKNIITIYLNNVQDKHYTLKHELYQHE